VDELDTPSPVAGDVLIEVAAAGVAYGDVMRRRGASGAVDPLPAGLGVPAFRSQGPLRSWVRAWVRWRSGTGSRLSSGRDTPSTV
jgi:hypothetical protein